MIKILILRLFDLFKVALLVKTFLFSYYFLFTANHARAFINYMCFESLIYFYLSYLAFYLCL